MSCITERSAAATCGPLPIWSFKIKRAVVCANALILVLTHVSIDEALVLTIEGSSHRRGEDVPLWLIGYIPDLPWPIEALQVSSVFRMDKTGPIQVPIRFMNDLLKKESQYVQA